MAAARRDVDARTRSLQTPATALVMQGVANPVADLKRERSRCTFDSEALARELYGGAEEVATRRRVAKIAASEPLFEKETLQFMSRQERYVRGAQVGVPCDA